MARQVVTVVSPQALHHNLQQVRHLAPQSKILAMVKANAYGHGLTVVAKTLQEADALGVACIEEALKLRHSGIKTDVVLMEGFFQAEELTLIQAYDLTLVLHHDWQIQALQQYSGPTRHKFKAWIKINTGMNRLGFSPEEFPQVWSVLNQNSKVKIIGFMTHFAQADEKANDLTQRQYEQFYQLVGDKPGQKSLANSAGILGWPQTHADWVRPGLILYGASPFPGTTGKDFNFKPAMSLKSHVIAIKKVRANEKVGYGGTWLATKEDSLIAIVAIGYGDGYPWHARSGTPILINDQRASVAGRVSMDMLAVDVTHLKEVQVGDSVTLWGEGLPVEEVAQHADTIPYELFCRFTDRIRVQVGE